MANFIRKSDKSGATIIEYGVLIGIVAAGVVAIVTIMGIDLRNFFQRVNVAEMESQQQPTEEEDPIEYTSFNPNNLGSAGTLSVNNLRLQASAPTAWASAIGLDPKATGKWYFEANFSGEDNVIGVASTAFDTNLMVGGSFISTGLRPQTNSVWSGGIEIDSGYTIDTWERIMVAYDADLNRIWFGASGNWITVGNPETGDGGISVTATGNVVPAVSVFSDLTVSTVVRAYFDEDQLNFPIPDGFQAWIAND